MGMGRLGNWRLLIDMGSLGMASPRCIIRYWRYVDDPELGEEALCTEVSILEVASIPSWSTSNKSCSQICQVQC